MVIDYSKVDGKMLYSKNSPAIMSRLVREKKQTGTEYDILLMAEILHQLIGR